MAGQAALYVGDFMSFKVFTSESDHRSCTSGSLGIAGCRGPGSAAEGSRGSAAASSVSSCARFSGLGRPAGGL